MGEAALKHITVDEFLVWDGEGDRRYELVRGETVAMAPPSLFHGVIVTNAAFVVKQKLKPPCRVISEAGIRLPGRKDTYYQADLAITCAPIRPDTWATPDPVVIIEVLSPTTMIKDCGIKLTDYRRIWSVKEVVLIHSEDKRVELFRRSAEAWIVIDLEVTDRITLESVGFDIPVEALYEGLDFSQAAVAHS
jgi:Uma2 family endonuclease